MTHEEPSPGPHRLDPHHRLPLYQQLRGHLASLIDGGTYTPGSMLPGEHRLREIYGVSRTVVRRALAELEHDGIIERVKGKGTFVALPTTPEVLADTLIGLFEEMTGRGRQVRSEVLRHESTHAGAAIARALEIPAGSPVVVLERLRFVDDQPWSWTTTYMPADVGEFTFGANLRTQSLYDVLAVHDIHPARGKRSVEAQAASAHTSRLLDVEEGHALLVLRSTARQEGGRVFEYFIAYHRASRFEFEIT